MAINEFLPRNSTGSLEFVAAFAIAFLFLLLVRGSRKRLRIRTIMGHLLDKRIWLHPSSLLDFQYILCSALFLSVIVVYFTIAAETVGLAVYGGLATVMGPAPVGHAGMLALAVAVIFLYLAHELAFWVDHYLSHKIPFLWEFHKVHHSAAVLTPFTNWRVHPVDTIVFYNILALFTGMAYGIVAYGLGHAISAASIGMVSLVFSLYMALYGHLQHSQIWIPVTGWLGRIVMSPAHHQIHHSQDVQHHDKNFGSALCLFDWLFGTLHMPTRALQRIRFGVEDDAHLKRVLPSLYVPFWRAGRQVVKRRGV